MSQPVPEETNKSYDVEQEPPGEHESDLPDADDEAGMSDTAEENAESSQDQPSS